MSVAPTPLDRRRAGPGFRLGVVAGALGAILIVLLVLARHGGSGGSSGVHGSGISATQVRHVPAFAAVELAGANDVAVRVGPKRSVVVEADDNLLAKVTTQVRGGTLVIGNRPGSWTTVSPMHVEVTVPSLRAVRLKGDGVVSVDGLAARTLTVSLPGDGLVRASGRVGSLDVALPGSGDAELAGLVARDVRAVVSGSGRVAVTATGALDAAVSGTGAVVYGGHPARVTTRVTGTGAVVPG
jgi:hypothetical protein